MLLTHKVLPTGTGVFVDGALQGHVLGKTLDALSELVDKAALRAAQEVGLRDERLCACSADGVSTSGQQERSIVDLKTHGALHAEGSSNEGTKREGDKISLDLVQIEGYPLKLHFQIPRVFPVYSANLLCANLRDL